MKPQRYVNRPTRWDDRGRDVDVRCSDGDFEQQSANRARTSEADDVGERGELRDRAKEGWSMTASPPRQVRRFAEGAGEVRLPCTSSAEDHDAFHLRIVADRTRRQIRN